MKFKVDNSINNILEVVSVTDKDFTQFIPLLFHGPIPKVDSSMHSTLPEFGFNNKTPKINFRTGTYTGLIQMTSLPCVGNSPASFAYIKVSMGGFFPQFIHGRGLPT